MISLMRFELDPEGILNITLCGIKANDIKEIINLLTSLGCQTESDIIETTQYTIDGITYEWKEVGEVGEKKLKKVIEKPRKPKKKPKPKTVKSKSKEVPKKQTKKRTIAILEHITKTPKTGREIAKEMGKNISTVSSRLTKLRKQGKVEATDDFPKKYYKPKGIVQETNKLMHKLLERPKKEEPVVEKEPEIEQETVETPLETEKESAEKPEEYNKEIKDFAVDSLSQGHTPAQIQKRISDVFDEKVDIKAIEKWKEEEKLSKRIDDDINFDTLCKLINRCIQKPMEERVLTYDELESARVCDNTTDLWGQLASINSPLRRKIKKTFGREIRFSDTFDEGKSAFILE